MMILVTGGSGSGKSAYAEGEVLKRGSGKRYYLATMMCFDEEGKQRIRRHRQMRKSKQFETIECPAGLKKVKPDRESTVLLECMSNLLANEMYAPDGAGRNAVEEILEGIRNLVSRSEHLVVVTNEVFSDGTQYDPDTVLYLKNLGEINGALGIMADRVVEVVCGIPLLHKGEH